MPLNQFLRWNRGTYKESSQNNTSSGDFKKTASSSEVLVADEVETAATTRQEFLEVRKTTS